MTESTDIKTIRADEVKQGYEFVASSWPRITKTVEEIALYESSVTLWFEDDSWTDLLADEEVDVLASTYEF